MSRIGVVTGSRIEGRCLRGASFPIMCSGADPERARRRAEHLIARGATALVSFGLAGALSPELASGALVLPQAVVTTAGDRYRVDGGWRKALWQQLEAAGITCQGGLLLGSDRLVTTPQTKQEFFESTAAVAVDMESHGVAVAAAAQGVPFVVLRAIADQADEAVPEAALAGLGGDGRTRILPLLMALARRPRELPLLVRLARCSRPGLRSLRAAATAAGPALALPSAARS